MSAPNPDLVGKPETREQFLAGAVFCRRMAQKTLDGKTNVRNPDEVAQAYINKAKSYERRAAEMPDA